MCRTGIYRIGCWNTVNLWSSTGPDATVVTQLREGDVIVASGERHGRHARIITSGGLTGWLLCF